MNIIIIGIIINAVILFLINIFPTSEYPPNLFNIILGPFLGLSVVGSILVAVGRRKVGAILVIIGCLMFFPIGIIGMWGARKVLDKIKEEEFEKRRQEVHL